MNNVYIKQENMSTPQWKMLQACSFVRGRGSKANKHMEREWKKGEIVPWKGTKLSTATNPRVGQKTTKNKQINKKTNKTNKQTSVCSKSKTWKNLSNYSWWVSL